MVEGDGQVNAPGGKLAEPLVVEVTDETGTHVENAVVSFRLPEDGVTGTFRNGLKTEILHTDADGRATLRNLTAGGLAGQFQVRMTVAKGHLRAGAVSTQFVSPAAAKAEHHMALPRPGKRTLAIGGAVLAVAASTYLKQRSSTDTQNTPTPTVIGAPTISVGKP